MNTKKSLNLSHFRKISHFVVNRGKFLFGHRQRNVYVQDRINFKPMSINLHNNERVNVNDVHRLEFDVFSTILLRYRVTCQKLYDKYSDEIGMTYLSMR
jgi:hypothetical protein